MISLAITPDDINDEVRGSLDVADKEVYGFLASQIEKATRRLLASCPTLEDRLSNNPAKLEIARDVVIEAVARVARMDDGAIGLKSESEDGYSYTVDPLTRSGNIWFPDKDLALLGCGAESMVPRTAWLSRDRSWAGF